MRPRHVMIALLFLAGCAAKTEPYRFPPGTQGLLANNDWEASDALVAVLHWAYYDCDRTWQMGYLGGGEKRDWLLHLTTNVTNDQAEAFAKHTFELLSERIRDRGDTI